MSGLPFFLTWVWNRVAYQAPYGSTLEKVNRTPELRGFFEVPPNGLKKTTFNDFVKYELISYLEPLIQDNLTELNANHLIKGTVVALNALPLDSPLNLGKSIDFEEPTPSAIEKVFQRLGLLNEVDKLVGEPRNSQRS